ncbi:MAG TPA: hypothetical protein VN259_07250 [Xanthomonadales bacterium]|nr:hypothetical protein [Xanthomonadales bacterium]
MGDRSAVERNTFWRSVGTLAWLPAQRYPLGMALMALLLLGGWALPVILGKPKAVVASLAVHAYVLTLVGMLSAMVWVSVCRPESQTLPGFKRALASVWGLYGLYLIALPGAVAHATGWPALLTAGGMTLLLATSIASGSGLKWAMLVWFAPMLLGIWPEFAKEIWRALRDSTLAPLLLFAVAAVILRMVWRRLMTISDGAPTLSPADINASDFSAAADAARIRQAGGLAQWMQKLQHRLSSRAFDGALAALQAQRPGAQRATLRMVLMPNAHWRGVALELVFTVLALGLLLSMLSLQRGGPPPIGLAASYIGMLTALRYQQLHRATMMLRPSLVDVYFAAAPNSQLEFTRAIVAALRGSLLPSMLFATVLLLLVGSLYPAEQRLPLLVGGLVGAFAASLAGLGMVLMLLDSERPRVLLGLMVLGVLGSIPTSLCVTAALRSPTAGVVVAILVLAGAVGFYSRARDYATRWPIRFDAPV